MVSSAEWSSPHAPTLDKEVPRSVHTEHSELASFCTRYSPRSPKYCDPPPEWEIVQLNGTRLLETASVIDDIRLGRPPQFRNGPSPNRYLWVIDHRGIPYILEAPFPFSGKERLPKHTNITEGDPAYVGGELWFSSNDSIFLSGGSGRYHPIDEQQLKDAVRVFGDYGYQVSSLGWDAESGYAARELADEFTS